jgi:hypothetical protein
LKEVDGIVTQPILGQKFGREIRIHVGEGAIFVNQQKAALEGGMWID